MTMIAVPKKPSAMPKKSKVTPPAGGWGNMQAGQVGWRTTGGKHYPVMRGSWAAQKFFKGASLAAFTDELEKIALHPRLKLLGGLGAGYLGLRALEGAGRKELDKYRLGRQVYKQMEQRRAQAG
jgi:hypothetical protein